MSATARRRTKHRSRSAHGRVRLARLDPAHARPPAHAVLPAARCDRPAARDRAGHGAQRLERRLPSNTHGNSYYWATKQVDVGADRAVRAPGSPPGCRCGCCASRAWPMVLVSLVLLVLTQTSLGRRGQRQPELARPRPAPDPAVGGREVLDGAVVRRRLRPQGRPAGLVAPLFVPGGAGDRAAHGAGAGRRRPGHRPGAVRDRARACSGSSACRRGSSWRRSAWSRSPRSTWPPAVRSG